MMKDENMYNQAFRNALETKRLYLAETLEQEDTALLARIDLGLGDWSAAERRRVYEQEVLPYWKKFGLVPKQFFFELAGSRDHRMDPRFLPSNLYYTAILPYMNNGLQHHGLMNKAYLDYLFCDVNRPETVALKIEGVCCDARRNMIREEEVIGLCRERGGKLFVKRSTGARGGNGIFVFAPEECTDAEILGVFREAGTSFVIQEQIRQHPAIQALNPSSVSTIRILSLLLEGEVFVESAVLRVSSPSMPYVTMHDGGFYIEILEDGRLHQAAYENNGAWFEYGKGFYDDSSVIPSMDKVFAEVKRLHPRIGHFKCVGWDFAVDVQGAPVLIEFNAFPGLGCSQTTSCRPVFGEQTDWILEDYFLRRTWEKNHRQDILIM